MAEAATSPRAVRGAQQAKQIEQRLGNIVVQMNVGPKNHRQARLQIHQNYPNRVAI